MSKAMQVALRIHPGSALWQRVPTCDEQGRPLADFMMILPGFNQQPEAERELLYAGLIEAFTGFEQQVVFVDLNLRLNLLWVSLRPARGVTPRLVSAIQSRLPRARLVASQAEVLRGAASVKQRFRRELGLLLRRG